MPYFSELFHLSVHSSYHILLRRARGEKMHTARRPKAVVSTRYVSVSMRGRTCMRDEIATISLPYPYMFADRPSGRCVSV